MNNLFMLKDFLVVESIEIPKDQVYLLVDRKPDETLVEWAKRCGVIYNIKKDV